MKNTSVAQFTPQELDYELARRRMFPPASLQMLPDDVQEEWISVADLRAELAAMPSTHPEYTWRQWELALAERQQKRQPNSRFYRVVVRANANSLAIAG